MESSNLADTVRPVSAAFEFAVVHANHAIQVVKTPTGYVDRESIHTTNDFFASKAEGTLLIGLVDEMLVEAFAMPSEILVRVAGRLAFCRQRFHHR